MRKPPAEDVLLVSGAALVTLGLALVAVWLALVVLGAAMIYTALRLASERTAAAEP